MIYVEMNMENYKKKIEDTIEYLNSIEFPGEDWKEDKVYFDNLEIEFAAEPEDGETKTLWNKLRNLIDDKRTSSLNRNKTTEELFAGWND